MLAEMTSTQWTLIGVGGALFLFGIIALVMGLRAKGKLSVIAGTSTASVAQAASAAGTAAGSQVEVKGVAESQQPLISPATSTPCLYYRHKVEGLRVYNDYDSQGRLQRHEDWDTVQEDERTAPFYLRDASGSILVAPDGAEFVTEQTMKGQTGAFGYDHPEEDRGVMDTVLDAVTGSQRGYYSRYRTYEWVVPVGRECYVLGSVAGLGDRAQVSRGTGKFIISCKSEEELSKRFKWHLVLWLGFGVLSLLSGAGLAIYGAVME